MPSLTALPRYVSGIAWSDQVTGVFTIGYSRLDGPDLLGQPYPEFLYDGAYDNVSERTLSFSYQRGRSSDLTEVQATSGSLEIVDDDEVYNPHNQDSPIAESLLPMRPYRITAVGPQLVPLTTNGWQMDDVVRARTVLGDTFADALLRKRPLGYWRFTESAGTLDYADAGGDPDMYAYPGTTLSNASPILTGSADHAQQLGPGGYLTIDAGDSVNPRATLGVVAVFSLNGGASVLYGAGPYNQGGWGGVFTKGGGRYIYFKPGQWSLRVDLDSRLAFAYKGTDGTQVDLRSVSQVIPGRNYFAALYWDGKTCRMWITEVGQPLTEIDVERPPANRLEAF